MGTEKDARYQLRLPKEMLQAAQAKAEEQELNLSQVIRRLLKKWLEDPPEGDE